jgi:hypothetical protein
MLFPPLPRERRRLALGRAFQVGQTLFQFSQLLLQLLNQRVALPKLGFQLGQTNLARIGRHFQSVIRAGHLIQSRSLATACPLSDGCSFPALWHWRTAPSQVER